MDREPQPLTFCNIQLFKTETLGTGSYGVVYKAMYNQRPCAAKLLHTIFFQSNDPGTVITRTRFEQECHFLNGMKHPHIVEYLGTTHDPESGLQVLLMELMDESLTHFLERSQQPLAYHIEVDLCHDIAQALAYIHSKGIIHRDLSSNNVLLLAGKAKITDFGMSKLLDINPRMTPLTMCPGTLVYMPPETIKDQAVYSYSSKMDCFCFGVLEIQIMTRQFPDPGPTMQMVEDPRYPAGRLLLIIPDSERRKSHIDLIDPTHALLPTALSCLSYSEEDRPSAQDLCQQLATFKETPRYTQSAQQAQEIQELRKQLVVSDSCIHSLQQQLQTSDQQLQDSQRRMHTLQQELQDSQTQLQDSQRENQQLTHQVKEKQHMIEDREQQLRQLHQQFQQNLLPHEQTISELRESIEREPHLAVEHATKVGEEQLREPNEQQLQPIKPATALEPEQNLKTIPYFSWKQSKAPQTMYRGSIAVDANLVYCNSWGSTAVHTYDSQNDMWGRVTDCSYTHSCLVIVQGVLTTVGGYFGRFTNALLSLTWEGWSVLLPPMITKREDVAAVYNDCSLVVAGGYDGRNRLATVEVLDTNTRQWSTSSSLLHPYTEATLGICGNRLYMLGGYDQNGPTHSVLTCSIPELLQSCQTQSLAGKLRTLTLGKKQVWQHATDAPHYFSTCSVFCDRLVAVGGLTEGSNDTTTISDYDERTDTWESMAEMPTAQRWALVATVSGKMIVIGGWVRGLTALDTVEIGTVL